MNTLLRIKDVVVFTAQFCLVIPALFGQDFQERIKLDHFTQRDGLSNHWIRDIIQDRRGFIWAATDYGINRFDGVKFKIYTPYDRVKNPPRDDHSQRFAIDHTGKMWLLDRYGLSFYDESNDGFIYIDLPQIRFPVHSDHHLLFDQPGKSLWLVTSAGVFRYDLTTGKLTSTAIKEMYRPFESLIDRKGRLIVAASEGAYVYNIRKNQFRFEDIDNDPNENCLSIFEDKDGRIWIGRWGQGIILFDPDSGRSTQYLPPVHLVGNSMVVFQDIGTVPEMTGDSVLWLSTLNNGILLFDLNKRRYVSNINFDSYLPHGLLTRDVSRLYSAGKGVYWIADEALSKMDLSDQQFKVVKLNLSDSEARLVLLDKGRKDLGWIADFKEGLIRYDFKHNKVLNKLHDPSEQKSHEWSMVRDMCYDSLGNLIIGGPYGLSIIDKKLREKLFPIYYDNIRYGVNILAPDRGDIIWLVSGFNILYKFNRRTGEKKHFFLPKYETEDDPPYVNSLLVQQDAVWAGSVNGLYKFDKNQEKFIRRYVDNTSKDSANLNLINHVSSDRSGRLWIAYARNGIKSMVPSEGKFVSYPATSELSVTFVESDANNMIWMQTAKGFYRFNPVSNRLDDFTTTSVIEFDGNTTQPLHAFNREWHVSSRSRYLLQLEPDKVPLTLPTAKPIITSFSIFNKPVPFNPDSTHVKEHFVRYDQNVISFEFSCPLYTRSDKVTFDYMLEGFDKTWVKAGKDRFAVYTNLDGGEYCFKVRSYNSLGELHEEPAVFRLLVETPFWLTWWFLLLCAGTFIGIVFFIFRYREVQRRKFVSIRDNIARDLHDDMGSNLSSIRILSQNIEKLTKLDPERARHALNKISETARDVMETMNDIVWSVNPENDSMEHLVGRMREFANELLEVKEIDIQFEADLNMLKMDLPPDKRRDLFLIYKEALTNVVRYAGSTMTSIRLYREGSYIVIRIEDNGVGFNTENPQVRNGGNGLKNMKSRAEKLGGRLEISSVPGQGTIVLFRCKSL